jgi:branched-chain amino acid transport system ATP-binding protein
VEAPGAGQGLPLLTAPAAPSTPPPLSLRAARAGYGRIEILHGVDLVVRRGEVTALLGPNGAGKTTALNVMSGLLQPTDGCRHVAGRHLNDADADALARLGIRHIREGRSVYPNLSVDDNLLVATSSAGSTDRIRDVAYTLFPTLKDRRTQLAGTLSGGEKQMLALARGLGADPAVLLIDELSMGLAPLVVAKLYDVVADVARAGLSVFVVEQFATLGLRYASHAYVMTNGKVTYDGPSAAALDAVHAAYLGAA